MASRETLLKEILDQFSGVLREQYLRRLPRPLADMVESYVRDMFELAQQGRPPRLVVVGRRGSGKSSLINAIFQEKVAAIGSVKSQTGRGQWYTYQGSAGALQILDTRGIGEGSRPAEDSNAANAAAEVEAAVREQSPDALLFLVKAKEVDAHIGPDVKAVLRLWETVRAEHHFPMPVVGVVTQVDELDPLRVSEPPFDRDLRKQANMKRAEELLETQLSRILPEEPLNVFSVCAYMEFEDGEIAYSRAWNVDALLTYLVDVLPKTSQMELARLAQLRSLQDKLARNLVRQGARIAAGLAAVPIPIADVAPLTALQLSLVLIIGRISGRTMDEHTAREFLAAVGLNVGVAYATRTLARQLVKLFPFPGAGSAVSAGMAYGATIGIGEAAIAYFIESASEKDARRVYERRREEARRETPNPEDLPRLPPP